MTEVRLETAADPNDRTGRGMLAFLDMAVNQGYMIASTGGALRTGVRKVLETEPGLETQDISSFDIDDIIGRFRIKQRANIREASLNEYEKRFRSVVEMYGKWLRNDPDWKPRTRAGASQRRGQQTTVRSAAEDAAPADTPREDSKPTGDVSSSMRGMVTYPYPIRPGILARITLPQDLTSREADRVARFIASLAFDEHLAITAGSGGSSNPASQES